MWQNRLSLLPSPWMEAEVPGGLVLTLPTALLREEEDPGRRLAVWMEGMAAVNR